MSSAEAVKRKVRSILDAAIEVPVLPSFTSIGSAARRRLFDWPPLDSYSLNDKTVVLTGATSGLGEAAAHAYAELGADLVIIARNAEKLDATITEIQANTGNEQVRGVIADLGRPADVEAAGREIAENHEVIHALVHNAGALFNTRKRAETGIDLAIEVMVAAPFALTNRLLPQLRAASPGRVITMSSGGMYTQPLSVSQLEMPDDDYNGAQQYGRAKRAQVAMNRTWSERVPKEEVVFHALHPGWAATPGVADALPGFGKVMGPLLRSPEDGADTMVWLTVAPDALEESGAFWHDRAVRGTHKLPNTASSDTAERRKRLWEWCEHHTGVTFDG